VRSAGLRNKPIDRRYLDKRDRADYNNSGAYGKAAGALARVRAYKGQQAYRRNTPPPTVSRRPGTGGLGGGIPVQQNRLRQYGQNRKSDASVRMPSTKGDLYSKPDKT
jgi:hypothetical protein